MIHFEINIYIYINFEINKYIYIIFSSSFSLRRYKPFVPRCIYLDANDEGARGVMVITV